VTANFYPGDLVVIDVFYRPTPTLFCDDYQVNGMTHRISRLDTFLVVAVDKGGWVMLLTPDGMIGWAPPEGFKHVVT
jgi:hypothetical protein